MIRQFSLVDNAPLAVEKKFCPSTAVIAETVYGRMFRSRHLCANLRIRQRCRIIARRCPLLILANTLSPAACFGIAAKRKQKHIAKIHSARSVEMGLRESANALVFMPVAAAVMPRLRTAIRRCLHHAERDAGARERMPRSRSAHKRIDMGCGVFHSRQA